MNTDTQSSQDEMSKRTFFIFLYIKETTDRIDRILNNYNIQTVFKPPKKIGQILRNPKDQRPPLSSAVYKILCSCRKVYIRETGRMVNIRMKEHQRDVRLKYIITQSALSEHNIETGHQILFDKTTTISYFPRK